MSRFPAWYQIADAFPPRLFHTAEEVPPGWTRLNKFYNTQTGQWEEGDPLDHDANGKKGGSLPKVDPADLPAIAGFVRDGFDRDDPEGGNPPRPLAQAERADNIVPAGKPQADTEAAAPKPRKRRAKKAAPKPAAAPAKSAPFGNRATSRRV